MWPRFLFTECVEYLGGKRRIAASRSRTSVACRAGEPPVPQPSALTKNAWSELFWLFQKCNSLRSNGFLKSQNNEIETPL